MSDIRKEASAKIASKLRQVDELIAECVAIADETGVTFDVNVGGYGMGGTYDPHDQTDQWGNDNYGWHASSQSC